MKIPDKLRGKREFDMNLEEQPLVSVGENQLETEETSNLHTPQTALHFQGTTFFKEKHKGLCSY